MPATSHSAVADSFATLTLDGRSSLTDQIVEEEYVANSPKPHVHFAYAMKEMRAVHFAYALKEMGNSFSRSRFSFSTGEMVSATAGRHIALHSGEME
ncbi:hypothetical protein PIB30_009546 [Stylosanthes scabra]|uniref:Uncharacterized protein n=1 Tax=Stylosanthes scabra TaxID=79078 RepID=A0ABU6Z345_9FABA|nr:hypothetical protein [Stylosanthes scabra]